MVRQDFRARKMYFGRISSGDFNLNFQPGTGLTFHVTKDSLLTIAKNKAFEGIAKFLKLDISTSLDSNKSADFCKS